MGANESLFGHNITDPSSGVRWGGGGAVTIAVLTHLCVSFLQLIYRCFKALSLTRILNPKGPHCWGKKGDEGMNPKPIKKLLLGAEFYVTVT